MICWILYGPVMLYSSWIQIDSDFFVDRLESKGCSAELKCSRFYSISALNDGLIMQKKYCIVLIIATPWPGCEGGSILAEDQIIVNYVDRQKSLLIETSLEHRASLSLIPLSRISLKKTHDHGLTSPLFSGKYADIVRQHSIFSV